MLALATIARPIRDPIKSSTSWVMVVMPRLYLRARLASENRKLAESSYFHELPRFVDDQDASALVGFGLIPDVIEDDIHGDGAQFVFEVADVKDD